MKYRTLGRVGPESSALGLGCMGMSGNYGALDDAESIRTLHRAVELGVTLFDTSDSYGRGINEGLVGRGLRAHRDRILLATKFGFVHHDDGRVDICGRPDYVRSACDASLRRLGFDAIDLYYQHRTDKTVPIEETVGAMAELVAAGKVRYLGLSEATPEDIRKAHAVHPIAALQSEFSLFSRDVEENGVLATIRELGIALVPFSPVGRGLLTGAIRSVEDFLPNDSRRHHPRFQGENFAKNLAVVDMVGAIARELDATTTQIALAWVLAQGSDIIPIPGTKRVRYVEENAAAAAIELTPAHLARIAAVAPKGVAAGARMSKNSPTQRAGTGIPDAVAR
jgi:aryl-alcohol dehydrogenase-like predicted oxidoreductase